MQLGKGSRNHQSLRGMFMSLAKVKEQIPDYGRDIRLNLDAVLGSADSGLSSRQVWGVALACAYALGSVELVQAVQAEGQTDVDDALKAAAQGAATIMAMNNVYYRAQHLMEDAEFKKLPARLRMNIIGKPGIEKSDFELMCFAVSAVSGCGQCLTSHLHELRKAGVPDVGSQTAIRIGSVFNAAYTALRIARL
jgi:alkyl hydroperoxide reductase subunit D